MGLQQGNKRKASSPGPPPQTGQSGVVVWLAPNFGWVLLGAGCCTVLFGTAWPSEPSEFRVQREEALHFFGR
jgi:hypothetical protein